MKSDESHFLCMIFLKNGISSLGTNHYFSPVSCFPGGRKFFSPSIEYLQFFSSTDWADNFPKSLITVVVSADNIFQMHLLGRQFISAFFLMQIIFLPITIPPGGRGEIMVHQLVLSICRFTTELTRAHGALCLCEI